MSLDRTTTFPASHGISAVVSLVVAIVSVSVAVRRAPRGA